ncbi:MAG: response regulator [Spirochaetaceae bacterium]|nr:MAG: response regulator [Spirochaetaceae bacterium]
MGNPAVNKIRRLTIGLLIDMGNPLNLNLIFRGIEEYCREKGYNLLCFDTRAFQPLTEASERRTLLENLINKKTVDGLIIIAGALDVIENRRSASPLLKRLHPMPMVTVGFSVKNIPSIKERSRKGVDECIGHLAKIHGSAKIAFISGPKDNSVSQERTLAFKTSLEKHKIREYQNLFLEGDFSLESGRRAIRALLEKKHSFDAVVACNDRMALGALEELEQHGMGAPGQKAIAAFEDEEISGLSSLPLTAIVFPHREAGRTATEILATCILDKGKPQHRILDTLLAVRESCGCGLLENHVMSNQDIKQADLPPFSAKTTKAYCSILLDNAAEISTEDREILAPALKDALDGLAKSLHSQKTERTFLQAWAGFTHILFMLRLDPSPWTSRLLILKNMILPETADTEIRFTTDDMLTRAILLTAEQASQRTSFRHFVSEQHSQAFRATEELLLPVMSVDQLVTVIESSSLPLGITSFFFSLADTQPEPLSYSTLRTAMLDRVPLELSRRTCQFLTNRLVPPGMLSEENRHMLVVEALCNDKSQLGLLLLGMDEEDLGISPHLAKRVSNALSNALHIQTINEAKLDLEAQISSRTMDLLEMGKKLQREILERERIASELSKSDAKYRKWFEDDFTGNFIAAANGEIIACNAAFARIFGFQSTAEAMEANFGDFYPNKSALEDFFTLLSVVKRIAYYEAEFIRKDGNPVHIIGNIIGTFDESNNLMEIQGFLFDNTERKHLEEELRQSHKMEAIGRLAGGIAHDFNNLLTGIMGYSELLRQKLPPYDPGRNDIEEIKKAAKSAASLTRQLLAFSRKQVLQPTVLNLNNVVLQLRDMLTRIIGEHIQLETELSEELYPVKADQGQLEQVLLNLTINSRDALPSGGRIVIATQNADVDESFRLNNPEIKPGRYAVLEVRDNGVGMDSETMSHIFEPFFTTKQDGQGVGLGLSTVYGIITQSGGFPDVDSEKTKGTAMRVYLPRFEEPLHIDEEPVFMLERVQSNETVLLVEDEEFVRELADKVLSNAGYHVLSARGGKEALSIARKHSSLIHLLITDVVMPGMNGLELSRKIVSIKPEIKILYMSGYTDNVITKEETFYHEINYIQKPFTPEVFLEKVQDVLDTAST